MDQQLRLLARAAEESGNLTLQILPFNSGAHAAAGDGSLGILQFAGTPGLGLVHVGGISGGVCREGRSELAAYAGVFQQHEHSRSAPPSPYACSVVWVAPRSLPPALPSCERGEALAGGTQTLQETVALPAVFVCHLAGPLGFISL